MKTIPLTQGQVALVSDEDYERVNQYKWHAHFTKTSGRYYARAWVPITMGGPRRIMMHRLILDVSDEVTVDHVSMETLDNRRENLRQCTNSQNMQNKRVRSDSRSGYKGVHWHKHVKMWCAAITAVGRPHHIGYFVTPQDAARAYDAEARKYFGEFAYCNFPLATS
jgi:hypothetical protein